MENSIELIKFISSFEEGGGYYGERIKELISHPFTGVFFMDDECYYDTRKHNSEYRQKLVDNKNEIQSLIDELLSRQSWTDAESKIYIIAEDIVIGDKPAGDKVAGNKFI